MVAKEISKFYRLNLKIQFIIDLKKFTSTFSNIVVTNASLKTENYLILYFVCISWKNLFIVNMPKKTLPKFHSNMSYKKWANKLQMWQKVTKLREPE